MSAPYKTNFSIPSSDPRAAVSKYIPVDPLIADIWVQIDLNVYSRRKHGKSMMELPSSRSSLVDLFRRNLQSRSKLI